MLVDDEEVQSTAIQEAIVRYEENHLRQLSYGESKVLISDLTSQQNGEYVDYGKKIKFTVSPLNENIDKLEELSEPVEEFVQLLYSAVDGYKNAAFKESITAVNGRQVSSFWQGRAI